MARPQKEINWEIVEKLIEYGSSGVEIAAKFRIQSDTFYRRFKEEYGCSFQDYRGEAQEAGLADLRAMIHAKALNNKAPGNSNLLIFLAKCRLGMHEPEVAHTLAANQNQIDQTHTIMQLQHRIAELEANGNKPETE
jgi:AraC-like DNA-binding protein